MFSTRYGAFLSGMLNPIKEVSSKIDQPASPPVSPGCTSIVGQVTTTGAPSSDDPYSMLDQMLPNESFCDIILEEKVDEKALYLIDRA